MQLGVILYYDKKDNYIIKLINSNNQTSNYLIKSLT